MIAKKVILSSLVFLLLLNWIRPAICKDTLRETFPKEKLDKIESDLELLKSEDKAKIEEALRKAKEKETLIPLSNLLAKASSQLRITILSSLVELSPAYAASFIIQALQEDKENFDSVIVLSLLCQEKSIIPGLILALGKEENSEKKTSISAVLRTITGQTFGQDKEKWSIWWKENEDAFQFVKSTDLCLLSEFQTNVGIERRSAAKKMFQEEMRKEGKEFLGPFVDMIDSSLKQLQNGKEITYPQATVKANLLFRNGRLEEALKEYEEGVNEEPKSIYSRYLLACILFEEGKFNQASKEFRKILKTERKIDSAKFLYLLSQRRKGKPKEDLLEATWQVFKGFRKKPGKYGQWDKLLTAINTESAYGKGIFLIEHRKLKELLKKTPLNLRILLGESLWESGAKAIYLLEAALEKNPKNISLNIALLTRYIQSIVRRGQLEMKLEGQLKRIISQLKVLRELDPQNSLWDHLFAYYSDYENRMEPSPSYENRPFSKKELKVIKKAVEKVKFNSYAKELRQAATFILEKVDCPFPKYLASNNCNILLPLFSSYRDLARRLIKNAEIEFEKGDFQKGEEYGQMVINFGWKISKDNNLYINELVASAIRQMGMATLIRQYKKVGNQAKVDIYSEQSKKEKELCNSYMEGFQTRFYILSSVPIPSLSDAVTQKLTQDEKKFYLTYQLRRK